MNETKQFPLLSSIETPRQLRELAETELSPLAKELRDYLVYSLNQCGGHFGAGMGVVELTIALHYVFNTPDDRLIWDVGHQGYPHKVLTGRRDQLKTIRQTHGLAPFLTREESEYDCFGVGHSSTSISAAAGMAVAAAMDNIPRKVVAIIGDGGLTGGMAFEALNHIGSMDSDVLVILNDNEMSISRNVGALTNYLARIFTGPIYSGIREQSKKVLSHMPSMKKMVKKTESHLKGMITPGTLFEELGFNYFGPIDGHDLPTLITTLKNLRQQTGARLLHIKTIKGKGYEAGEQDPIKYHAVKAGFHDIDTEDAKPTVNNPTYSQIFGDWLCDMAAQDNNLVAITPAMCGGSGMERFATEFPNQFHDVGIAEQHSITFAASLACEGKKPIVAIYSTFLQRGYDQLIHDVALQNLDVTFALDRSSLVTDGPTHAGIFDFSFMRCIPNLIIMAASNENECRQMLSTAYQYKGPASVRYPRGYGPGTPVIHDFTMIEIGKAEICRHGEQLAILSFGAMLTTALAVGEKLNATVVNMRFVKPLDEKLITKLSKTHKQIVTIEENVIKGGAGSAVNEFILQNKLSIACLNLGLPDEFPDHGNRNDLLKQYHLDAKSIEKQLHYFTRIGMSSIET